MKRSRLVAGATGAITAIGVATIGVVGPWEGLRLVAYQDVVGVWTACYGETKGIKPGMRFSEEACDVMFIGSLTEHEAGMRQCLKAPDALPDKTYVAFVSVTYNIGTGAFCGSSMARRANAGDLVGACEALTAWNKAGGKVVQGLTNRRIAERKLCLEGLAEGRPAPLPEIPAPQPAPPAPPAPAPLPPAPLPPVAAPAAPAPAPLWPLLLLVAGMAAAAGLIIWRRKGRS